MGLCAFPVGRAALLSLWRLAAHPAIHLRDCRRAAAPPLEGQSSEKACSLKLNSLGGFWPPGLPPAGSWTLRDCVYSMGKARDEQRLARALRGAGLGALTLLLGLWALSGTGGGGRYDSGIDFDGRFEDASGGSYVPFGTVRTEGTRRPLRPLEMCSWETALEVGGHVHRWPGRNGCLQMHAWCSQSRLVWEISSCWRMSEANRCWSNTAAVPKLVLHATRMTVPPSQACRPAAHWPAGLPIRRGGGGQRVPHQA